MKVARFILKVTAISLAVAAVVCTVIAYWDKLTELCGSVGSKVHRSSAEYEDYVE